MITNGGRERPQPGKRNVPITTPPPPPRPSRAPLYSSLPAALPSSAAPPSSPGPASPWPASQGPASPGPASPGPASPGPASRGPASPGRRGFLLAGGAVGAVALLGGCSDGSAARPDAAGRGPGEERLRTRGARDSAELLARYDATADAHPGLADRLRPLREETARHLEAFRAPGRGASSGGSSASASSPASAPVSPSAAPSASGSSGEPRAPKVPEDEKEALAALARAERRTADTRTAALRDATPELARLLASVAACGAAHAYLLTARGS
ncbi:hypothetical protein ACI2L4_37845 [Streptomyces sparsogenes]|uniref:hypothetical protein n=1 Tax=Streptomyces sparsogenes TaxID=67365 RepID=UPI00384D35AC